MTITEALKRFRVDNKLTQRDVANVLNVSSQLYQHYEKNGDMSVVKLLAIANHYGVSTDYLLGRSDSPQPNSSTPSPANTESTESVENQIRALRLELLQLKISLTNQGLYV